MCVQPARRCSRSSNSFGSPIAIRAFVAAPNEKMKHVERVAGGAGGSFFSLGSPFAQTALSLVFTFRGANLKMAPQSTPSPFLLRSWTAVRSRRRRRRRLPPPPTFVSLFWWGARVAAIAVLCRASHFWCGTVLAASSESTPLYLRSAYPLWEPQPASANSGERLSLTPYLERGKTDEARKVAKVGPGLLSDQVASYSGYFTVDRRYNSNLFFWFFPSQSADPTAPLILWLQGGPGASSLYGLFEEIGPFKVECTSANEANTDASNESYRLIPNPHSWNLNYSLLFIDSPVGTGFSYTEHKDGYATNQSIVAHHSYQALKQFYKMFPEYVDNDFYLAGESYAGKYIPSLAHTIHEENGGPETFYINLKGVMIGNGFVDPESMLAYSEYTYQLGLIDAQAKSEMQKLEAQGRKAIREKHFIDAFYSWSGILSLFIGESKFHSLYDAQNDRWTWNVTRSYVTYVQRAEVRRAMHVGDAEYTSLGVVYYKMIPDFMADVRPQLRTVLDHYRVLLYGGQFDIVCAYPLAVAATLRGLRFAASDQYQRARRRAWYVDGQLAGYVKTAANLTEALIRNAGHMAAHDKPEWAYRLVTDFISGSSSAGTSGSLYP